MVSAVVARGAQASDDRRSGRIADPVHGYVEFTWVERRILDHPVAQRLRYVGQSGLAHLVFPELRTSRFAHSLGAMHLASRFLSACLRNSEPAVRDRLVASLHEAVEAELGQVGNPSAAARDVRSGFLSAHHHCSEAEAPYIVIAEQALRLAALFHDLGHLPFSHDFEYALEDAWRSTRDNSNVFKGLRPLIEQRPGRTAIHEEVGHQLARQLLVEFMGERDFATVAAVFNLAFRVLTVDAPDPARPGRAAVVWLHGLMSGELDVDRCDYLLRDGRNYGFEFAGYNLDRMLLNLVTVEMSEGFGLAIQSQGLSAVESFLLSRFRSYQHGVRHHKVAQVGLALRTGIGRIVTQSATPQIQSFLRDLGIIASLAGAGVRLSESEREELLDRFSRYDDVWWIGIMREFALAHDDEWLALACWRRRGPRSLWKRSSDLGTSLAGWQETLGAGDRRRMADDASGTSLLQLWNLALPDLDDPTGQRGWLEALTDLKNQGVLITRHHFQPWKSGINGQDSILSIRAADGTLIPVSRLSSLTRALREAWAEDVQVHAFAESSSTLTASDVLDRLSAAMRWPT